MRKVISLKKKEKHLNVSQAGQFEEHGSAVWRVSALLQIVDNYIIEFNEMSFFDRIDMYYVLFSQVCWNVTGTILASSGDDGCVKLWKANYMDAWKCVATLRGDGQAALESLPASLGKQGFTKLPMSSHQANWH